MIAPGEPRLVRAHGWTRGWPGVKRFAFTVCDDADEGTLGNIVPVYRLLEEIGLRTTKSAWVFPPDPSHGFTGDSLENPAYRDFLLRLREKGFGLALHGVRSGDSPREMVEEGLRRWREVFGEYPVIHLNHARNRDNVHWGDAWLPWWRRVLLRKSGRVFEGTKPGSPYFWGDICSERIRYVRGRTFHHINTIGMDPWMPYHEPRFPWVAAWFSSSDGADETRFERLLSEENQDLLEAEGGCCIVYTHFGKGFVGADGRVVPVVERLLRRLASRSGWFAPVEEVLRFLDQGRVRILTPWQRFRLDMRIRWERWSRGSR